MKKTILITSIAAFALTHAATAGTWFWFRGDIGVGSPFVSSATEKQQSAARTGSNQSTPRQAKDEIKSKRTDQRITAR